AALVLKMLPCLSMHFLPLFPFFHHPVNGIYVNDPYSLPSVFFLPFFSSSLNQSITLFSLFHSALYFLFHLFLFFLFFIFLLFHSALYFPFLLVLLFLFWQLHLSLYPLAHLLLRLLQVINHILLCIYLTVLVTHCPLLHVQYLLNQGHFLLVRFS